MCNSPLPAASRRDPTSRSRPMRGRSDLKYFSPWTSPALISCWSPCGTRLSAERFYAAAAGRLRFGCSNRFAVATARSAHGQISSSGLTIPSRAQISCRTMLAASPFRRLSVPATLNLISAAGLAGIVAQFPHAARSSRRDAGFGFGNAARKGESSPHLRRNRLEKSRGLTNAAKAG